MTYIIPLDGIHFPGRRHTVGSETPRLFEMLAHNLTREPKGEAIFLFFRSQPAEKA
jgi:hypothetical protein